MLCRWRWFSAFVVLAFILAHLAVPAAGWAQDATPGGGVCGDDTTPDDSGTDPLPGISREASDLTQIVLPDRNIVAGWSLLCAEPGTAPNTFMQEGHILLDVLQGSLTIELIELCGLPPCSTTSGELRLGAPDANGVITWTVIAMGSPPQVVTSLNVVALSDVTVELTFGAERTRFFSSGWAPLFPGGGCTGVCWRFP